jgi:hypothetical protein
MVVSSKTHRGVLWLLLLLALLAAGVGAAVPFLTPGLPDPAVANREELLRWLVTRDLGQESSKTRLVIVQRLEQEFRAGVDWEALSRQTTEAQRKQLWCNIPLLLGPWLTEKASLYSQLPDAKRIEFIDGVIDSLQAWRGADQLQAPQSAETPSAQRRGAVQKMFLDQVEECKRSADQQQRDRIAQFVAALQFRFLMR